MNIKPILQKIGLSQKEVDIYLTCLEHGPETITNLARLSGYKRSTLYNMVEKLLRDGFIILIRRHKRTLYDAEKPRKLLISLRARERELEQLMPQLEEIRNTKKEITNVETYESPEAVKILYDEIYDSFNYKEEVCFLTSMRDLFKNLPEVVDAYLAKIEGQANYKIRELIFNDEDGRRYVKLLRGKDVSHQIRLLPPDFLLYNDLVICGDKVVIFSYKNRIVATKFDNKEIATTMKTLFEWAWKNAKVV